MTQELMGNVALSPFCWLLFSVIGNKKRYWLKIILILEFQQMCYAVGIEKRYFLCFVVPGVILKKQEL